MDVAALADTLRRGRLGGANLDVFDNEPPRPGHLLLDLDRTTFSHHIAGLTLDAAERMAVASVHNVLDYFAGRIDASLVVSGAGFHVV